MERNVATDSSQEVSVRGTRGWRPLGAVALAGLNVLALWLSLAGSPLAWLAWGGVLAGLASRLLFSGGGRRFPAGLPGLPPGKSLGIATSLLILLSLVPGSAPAAHSQALVSLSLRSQPGTLAPGDLLTWIATARGPGNDLDGLRVSLVLPAGTRFVAATGPEPCTTPLVGSSGGTVSCPVGDSSVSGIDTDVVTIKVRVDPDFHVTVGAATIHVTAELRDGEIEAQADAVTQVRPRADLAVTKVSTPGTSVRAGETFTYTISVDNRGPSTARNVVLTDTLLSDQAFTLDPPTFVGATYTCATSSTPSGGQVLVCPRDDNSMDPGERDTIIVTGRANEATTINDTLEVSSPDDPLMFNNTAWDSLSIQASADLKISKQQTDPPVPHSVTAGQKITYTLTVTNTGPSTADSVVVRDTLPGFIQDNVQISASSGVTCTLGLPGPVMCNLDTLAPGAFRTINLTLQLDPGYPIDPVVGAEIQNQATVSSRTFDPDDTNNVDSVATQAVASADLSVTKTSVPTTVKAGDTFQYDVSITNTGPSTAQDIVFEDPMPAPDFTPVNASLGSAPFSLFGCSLGGGDNTLRCNISSLPPGTTITGTINVRLAPDALRPYNFVPHTFTNTARVFSATPDAGPGPNTASAQTTVVAEADLDLTGSGVIDLPDPVVAGTRLTYRISLTNLGPSVAPVPVVTSTFSFTPTATGVVTYAGASELCAQTGPDEIVCQLQDALGRQERHSFSLFVDVAPSFKGQITNIATTGSGKFDPQLVNNLFVQDTRVIDQADLRVTKLADQGHDSVVVAGTPLTYTITVENSGPSDARNVVLTDTLDPQVTFFRAVPDRTSGPNPLVWHYLSPQLAVGGRITVSVVVTANQDITQPLDTLSDRVEVSSETGDPNPLNNSTTKFTLLVTPCQHADVNADNVVNLTDVQLAAAAWRTTDFNPRYDLDGDGVVTVSDFQMVAAQLGKTCP
jgi:uncharacterized repeat protein (TIGR01451 family)